MPPDEHLVVPGYRLLVQKESGVGFQGRDAQIARLYPILGVDALIYDILDFRGEYVDAGALLRRRRLEGDADLLGSYRKVDALFNREIPVVVSLY